MNSPSHSRLRGALIALPILLGLCASACGGGSPSAPLDGVVEDAAAPLSADPDELCRVRIVQANETFGSAVVRAGVRGPLGSADSLSVLVDFTIVDDGDGVVGAGDVLTFSEPANLWGPEHAGMEFEASLRLESGAESRQLFAGTFTAR